MSDDLSKFDMLRALKGIDRRIGQTEVKEVPGPATAWTPVLQGDGTAGTFTYATQLGQYNRIGPLIFARFYVQLSAISVAPVGSMRIAGLPVAAAAAATIYSSVVLGFIHQVNLSAGCIQLNAYVDPGTTYFWLEETFDAANSAHLPAGAIAATTGIIGQAIYQI